MAAKVLKPVLRSQNRPQKEALELSRQAAFKRRMLTLFQGEATGALEMASLHTALRWIRPLENRAAALEPPAKQRS